MKTDSIIKFELELILKKKLNIKTSNSRRKKKKYNIIKIEK